MGVAHPEKGKRGGSLCCYKSAETGYDATGSGMDFGASRKARKGGRRRVGGGPSDQLYEVIERVELRYERSFDPKDLAGIWLSPGEIIIPKIVVSEERQKWIMYDEGRTLGLETVSPRDRINNSGPSKLWVPCFQDHVDGERSRMIRPVHNLMQGDKKRKGAWEGKFHRRRSKISGAMMDNLEKRKNAIMTIQKQASVDPNLALTIDPIPGSESGSEIKYFPWQRQYMNQGSSNKPGKGSNSSGILRQWSLKTRPAADEKEIENVLRSIYPELKDVEKDMERLARLRTVVPPHIEGQLMMHYHGGWKKFWFLIISHSIPSKRAFFIFGKNRKDVWRAKQTKQYGSGSTEVKIICFVSKILKASQSHKDQFKMFARTSEDLTVEECLRFKVHKKYMMVDVEDIESDSVDWRQKKVTKFRVVCICQLCTIANYLVEAIGSDARK
ncbi:hypothetical protein AAMO2058_001310400 [Amorphochlora amoebiformis]